MEVLIHNEAKNGGKYIKKGDDYTKHRFTIGFLGYVFLYTNGNKQIVRKH